MSATAETFAVRRRELRSAPGPVATDRGAFTRDQVIEAIRSWCDRYGAPPTLADWEPSRARRSGHLWRVERFEAGRWPTTRMVRRHFRTFGEAIEVAGFPRPRARGVPKGHLVGSSEILRAIRAWTRRYGDVPAGADWDPVRARVLRQEWRVHRFRDGDWPSLATVRHHFGSLTDAIVAAGMHPRRPVESHVESTERRTENRRALTRLEALNLPAAGPVTLADVLTRVAAARKAGDAQSLEEHLVELVATALAWADGVRTTPEL